MKHDMFRSTRYNESDEDDIFLCGDVWWLGDQNHVQDSDSRTVALPFSGLIYILNVGDKDKYQILSW